MLEKIKSYGIDLYILIIDEMTNKYKAEPFKFHSNYNSYQLKLNFEDWTGIIDDGKEHIYILLPNMSTQTMALL